MSTKEPTRSGLTEWINERVRETAQAALEAGPVRYDDEGIGMISEALSGILDNLPEEERRQMGKWVVEMHPTMDRMMRAYLVSATEDEGEDG